jgi:hypothetical protein
MTLMTQAAFAARRGVGKSAVSNWKKAGLVVFGEGDGGKLFVDVERTDARLNARLDPMRGRPSAAEAAPELPIGGDADDAAAAGGGRNLAQARAELVDEDLFGRRLKNAAAAGELVPLIEEERRLSAVGRMIRERIAAEERNVAERLAATSDVRAVMAILDEARTKAFLAMASAIAGGELDEPDEAEASADQAEAA